MAFSKTIQMYIFEGNPNGRIMCDLSNWNGRVYKISRNELSEFSKRPDAYNTGVYFLLGKDESNMDTVYVGEAEKILTRLKQHLNDPEYWSDCIVVISKDNLLNKAHVKYLENKFYSMAKAAGRSTVINSTIPTCSSLSEYDEAMLEEFISDAKLLVNTLGYKIFDTIAESTIKRQDGQTYFYIQAAHGANAKGVRVADGFAVLKDSIVSNTAAPHLRPSIIRFRDALLEKGIINQNYQLTQDYIFTSPSLAATIVLGSSANGRVLWKTQTGKSIRDLEQSDLTQSDRTTTNNSTVPSSTDSQSIPDLE